MYRRFLIRSHDNISLVIPNNKMIEHCSWKCCLLHYLFKWKVSYLKFKYGFDQTLSIVFSHHYTLYTLQIMLALLCWHLFMYCISRHLLHGIFVSRAGFEPGSSLECMIEHTQPLRQLSHHGWSTLKGAWWKQQKNGRRQRWRSTSSIDRQHWPRKVQWRWRRP